MFKKFEFIKMILHEKKGQSLIEYEMIIALISIVAITVMSPLGTKIRAIFEQIVTNFPSV